MISDLTSACCTRAQCPHKYNEKFYIELISTIAVQRLVRFNECSCSFMIIRYVCGT